MKRKAGVALAGVVCLCAVSSFGQTSGKEVYDKTCKECHGDAGQGNSLADKFYEVRIPRLNSDFVQKKSDAELKEIMTKGRRRMGPPRVGQMMKHPTTNEMDAVIAYIRSLKK